MNSESKFNPFTLALAIAMLSVTVTSAVWILAGYEPEPTNEVVTQDLTCGIITPNGMVGTIKGEVKNGTITDFGIIKHKDGLYIPTVNEVCILVEKGD